MKETYYLGFNKSLQLYEVCNAQKRDVVHCNNLEYLAICFKNYARAGYLNDYILNFTDLPDHLQQIKAEEISEYNDKLNSFKFYKPKLLEVTSSKKPNGTSKETPKGYILKENNTQKKVKKA